MTLSRDYDFVFKILFLGNSSVGKSSLLTRYSDDVFQEGFLPTIGVDFKIRTIEQDGALVKLQMWDTAGQEKFRTITQAYYKGSHGIILVFDITDRRTFTDIQHWLIDTERFSHPQAIKVLIGNKLDLEAQRVVTKEEAEQFASANDMKYIETSAKASVNVQKMFTVLSKAMMSSVVKLKKDQGHSSTRLKPVDQMKEKVSTCC